MQGLDNDMATVGKLLDDEDLVQYILVGLDEDYDSVVNSVLARPQAISVGELLSQVQAFESRVDLRPGGSGSSANFAGRGGCGGFGRRDGRGRSGRGGRAPTLGGGRGVQGMQARSAGHGHNNNSGCFKYSHCR
jgi:hypothetical protein